MQAYKICMIFAGLGLMWGPSFALAQNFSSDLLFRSKADIHKHIEALDAFEDKFNDAIPTEDGKYLLDINEASVSGVMASLVFYRELVQSREGGYSIRYASGKGPLGLDLGEV